LCNDCLVYLLNDTNDRPIRRAAIIEANTNISYTAFIF